MKLKRIKWVEDDDTGLYERYLLLNGNSSFRVTISFNYFSASTIYLGTVPVKSLAEAKRLVKKDYIKWLQGLYSILQENCVL